MNKIKSIFGLMLAAALTCGAFTSCQDDIDAPDMKVPVATIERNTSIAEVKEKYWQDGNNYIESIGTKDNGEHVVIAGRVISSDRSGNIYKSLIIQDETAALSISLNHTNLYTEYRIGQEVVIDLTGMYIGKYASLQQLGYPSYDVKYGDQATFMSKALFDEHAQLNGLPEENKVKVLDIKISDLGNSKESQLKYQSQLVRLHKVTFDEGGVATFCTAHKENTNRTIKDENGVSLTVRTSGYANFWATKLPAGPVDMIGIVTTYNGDWQFVLRSLDDILDVDNKGTEDNPYDILEAVQQIADGTSVNMKWFTGYIVGTVKPEVSEVSSAEDFQFEAPFIVSNTLVIGQTPESKSIEECVIVRLPLDSPLREYGNLHDHSDNLGRQIWLVGTPAEDMGTNALAGNSGSANEFRIEGVETGGGSVPAGNGTEENPYNVSQVVAMGTDANVPGQWMSGYIVGWADSSIHTYLDAENAMFNATGAQPSNLLMADTPDETDVEKCVIINLPSNTDVRSALNLKDNTGNLGRKVAVYGNISRYFNHAGMRELSKYKWLDGGSTPVDPEPPVSGDPVTSIDESFAAAVIPSGWSVKTTSGNRDWLAGSFSDNNFVKCTGYKGTAGANGFESWFISPAVNISAVTDKTLSFASAAGYAGNGTLEVYVLSSADPATATQTKLNAKVATPPGSGFTDFVPSGDISLAQFSGIIYIGFRYYAAAGSDFVTYEVDDIKLGTSGTGGGDDPTPGPVDPADVTSADFNTFNEGKEITTYGSYTSADGWQTEFCAIARGGGDNVNKMLFPFLGGADVFGVVIDGTTLRPGKLTSPVLANGCKTLMFKYGFAFNENNGVQFTVNVKQNGAQSYQDY